MTASVPATTTPEVRVVLAWHAALNRADVDALVALSDPAIEVVGPRGVGRGTALLRGWVERAAIRLEPRRLFSRGETVVVEQAAEWVAAAGERQTVASVFLVRGDLVARVARCPDLAAALGSAKMDETHEVGAN